ncbi:hypothetical protein B0H16DRAFT_1886809 [Mycena metata]|uniref:Uncharacterized protein n=1 Tax=Mycena metata TaxID=1033252 RepID=A0AAD7IZK0_9AGAR|nr:hypothetical protein B0H16DRAFT_1886809 [Mycena metata]
MDSFTATTSKVEDIVSTPVNNDDGTGSSGSCVVSVAASLLEEHSSTHNGIIHNIGITSLIGAWSGALHDEQQAHHILRASDSARLFIHFDFSSHSLYMYTHILQFKSAACHIFASAHSHASAG